MKSLIFQKVFNRFSLFIGLSVLFVVCCFYFYNHTEYLVEPKLVSGSDNLYVNPFGVYRGICDSVFDICWGVSHYEKIQGADPKTFQIINRIYSKDKQRIYANGKVISNDALNFSLLYSQGDDLFHLFAKDSHSVYYNGNIIEGADPSFHLVAGDPQGVDGIYQDNSRYYYKHLPVVFYDPVTKKSFNFSLNEVEWIPTGIDAFDCGSKGDAACFYLFKHKSTEEIFVITIFSKFSLPPKATKIKTIDRSVLVSPSQD